VCAPSVILAPPRQADDNSEAELSAAGAFSVLVLLLLLDLTGERPLPTPSLPFMGDPSTLPSLTKANPPAVGTMGPIFSWW